jgi:uncharacterized delta-60 repeat protein
MDRGKKNPLHSNTEQERRMSYDAHEQLPTSQSSGQQSGAAHAAPKRLAAAAALLTLALGQLVKAADGQLDLSFGGDGLVTFDVPRPGAVDGAGLQDQLFGLAVLPDNKIVVGGSTRARSALPFPPIDFAVARFNESGALDRGFGTEGLMTTDISGPQPAVDFANGLVLQNHQGETKILLVGRSGPNESSRFAAVRYHATGAPDLGFGVGGIVEIAVPGGSESIAFDIAVQPDDSKIILAGMVGTQLGSDFALVRYNPNGSLDDGRFDGGGLDDGGLPDSNPGDRFGSDGTVRTSFFDSQLESASAVIVQLDGKIVAGGGIRGDFALVRYNRDGSLDNGVRGK